MSKQDDSSEASCILSALEMDLVPNLCPDVPSALRHVFARSKQRPAPVVQALLLPNLTLEQIQKSHETLLQQNYLVGNDGDSSLVVMKRVAATVWFLQLLLECPSVLNNEQQQQQVHQMALELLAHFIKTIQTLLQKQKQQQTLQENQDEDDTIISTTTLLNAPTVASFAVGALLKVVNPYVSTLPILLSPLWKGICTLCSSQHAALPPQVANETLAALCHYLREGTIQMMHAMKHYIETRNVVPQFAWQLKIVTFLVAKCAVLLQNLHFDDQSTLSNAISLLLQLRGLTGATRFSLIQYHSNVTPQDELFLSQQASLHKKVETCLVDSFSITTTRTSSCDLELLLRLVFQSSQIKYNKELLVLASSSFDMGKALTLVRLLREFTAVAAHDETTTTTTQSLLQMIQELLFSTLPRCYTTIIPTCGKQQQPPPDLLSSSLLYMVSTTSLLDVTAETTRSQVHRLLVSWLAPCIPEQPLHPMTREMVISLVHLHVVRVAQHAVGEEHATSDSPRSVDIHEESEHTSSLACSIQPLTSLLVQVLVDSRTMTVHRRNVASVVIRLLMVPFKNDSLLLACRNIRLVLQQTLAMELHKVVKVDVKARRRKRKRTKTTSAHHESTSCRPLGSFAANDVQVIAQVLKRVSVYTLPSLDGLLSSLARELTVDNDSSSRSSPKYMIGNYSRNASSLLLALASGILQKSSTLESFKNKTGMQVGDFVSFIITWLVGQQRGGEAMRIRASSQAVVIVACLDLVATSLPHVATMPADQLRILVNLVKEYSRVSSQVLQLDSPPRSANERQSAVSLLFSVAALLAGATRVIPTCCPPDILQGIASTYQMLFQTNSWPIVARTVTSLVQFASTIPSAHQGILPECIPTDSQGLLQCRLQGLVYRKADSHKESESIAVNANCSRTLKRLIPVLKHKASLFVTTSNNDHIREGSYVLTMPTEDGRSATVIFAPGEESLSDIKYMLGKDNFDDVQVRQLEQVRLMGNGCRFLSKTLDL